MNPILKWSGIVLGGLAGVALLAVIAVYLWSQAILDQRYPPPASFHAASGEAARGLHLARIAGCTDCHGADLEGKLFADVPGSAIYAKNLRLLHLSDADYERAIRHALKPDGTSVLVMPSDVYRYLSDGEVSDLIAYLRSLKPDGAQTPEPRIGLLVRLALVTGQLKTDAGYFADTRRPLDMGPRFAAGRHLANIACAECHAADLRGTPDDPILVTPDLAIAAAYERADFIRLMRTGKAAGNREVGVMSATARTRFVHFSDAEIAALHDYLSARGQKGAQNP